MKYLAELEKIEVKMVDRYLRDLIRTQNIFVLSTQTADEIDILHLCDYVMGVPAADPASGYDERVVNPTARPVAAHGGGS